MTPSGLSGTSRSECCWISTFAAGSSRSCGRAEGVVMLGPRLSPATLELVADEDRDAVQEQKQEQQDDDSGRSDLAELLLRLADPVVDLHRQRREPGQQTVGVEGDEHERTEQQQWRRLTDRTRHG